MAENKINIAELLKNCPKGMELDCTMFENVTFVQVHMNREQFPIEIAVGGIRSKYLTKEGCFHDTTLLPESKCVIFPKGKTTWEGFVPPCKFKDGDVISAVVNKNLWCGIYQKESNAKLYCYASYSTATESVYLVDKYGMCLIDDISEIRLATEEEKQILFDAIKANGCKWNEETKTLEKLPKFKVGNRVKSKINQYEYTIADIRKDVYIMNYATDKFGYHVPFCNEDNFELIPNKFDINTLKPFDKVLVRDNDIKEWCISFFSHCNGLETYKYSCINSYGYARCIPYEGNEHLLGTTNDCDDFYKTWEK